MIFIIYAISDIHGCYDEFIKMLQKIDFSKKDELYIIGDVIDRGNHPIKLLNYIRNQDNMTMIMGNHEKMMLDAISGPERNGIKRSGHNVNLWYRNGGSITDHQFMKLNKEEQEEILLFLKNLPLGLEITVGQKNYMLIHGGPTPNFVEEWNMRKLSEDVLWERIEHCSSEDIVYPGKIIVVGHTPTYLYGATGIIKIGDKRLIDCGCVFGGGLGCICLDTEECFYI
jgi:serine/threonine protein phosphatase 1